MSSPIGEEDRVNARIERKNRRRLRKIRNVYIPHVRRGNKRISKRSGEFMTDPEHNHERQHPMTSPLDTDDDTMFQYSLEEADSESEGKTTSTSNRTLGEFEPSNGEFETSNEDDEIRTLRRDFKSILQEFFANDDADELSLYRSARKWLPFRILSRNIASVQRIRVLNLSCNKLKRVPDVVLSMDNLFEFKCNRNHINTIPDDMCNLRNLKILDLSYNRFRTFPTNILASAVEFLDLEYNLIDNIPQLLQNQYESNIRNLKLGMNRLRGSLDGSTIATMAKLEVLSVNGMDLTHLPVCLIDLPRLRKIFAKDNPLQFPPLVVVESGPLAIKQYFESTNSDHNVSTRTRGHVILLGNPSAGKTSLMNALQQEHGDLINNLNIWDSIGFDCVYHVNRIVATKSTMYVVVWDLTSIEDLEHAVCSWISSIQYRVPGASVIIVGSKADLLTDDEIQSRLWMLQRILEDYEDAHTSELQLQFEEGIDNKQASMLLHQRPNIHREVICVSSLDGINIDTLRAVLSSNVPQPCCIPQTWTDAEKSIKEMHSIVVALQDIPGESRDDIRNCVRYLHEVGEIIYVSDTTVFLDASWVVKSIHRLVDINNVVPVTTWGRESSRIRELVHLRESATISANLFRLIWPTTSPELIEKLVELFEKSDIMIPLSHHQTWLIPAMLKDSIPLTKQWAPLADDQAEVSRSLVFYGFAPTGLIGQLVAGLSTMYSREMMTWSNAIKLRIRHDREYVRVLLHFETEKRDDDPSMTPRCVLDLRVRGGRTAGLTSMWYVLEELLMSVEDILRKSFLGLTWISAVRCSKCSTLLDLADLQQYAEMDRELLIEDWENCTNACTAMCTGEDHEIPLIYLIPPSMYKYDPPEGIHRYLFKNTFDATAVCRVGIFSVSGKKFVAQGSGFVVDKSRGLIMSAAHILVDPSTMDFKFSLESHRIVIGCYTAQDTIPEWCYEARFLRSGTDEIGFLDAMVLEIASVVECPMGNSIFASGLQMLPRKLPKIVMSQICLGNSSKVNIGDPISLVGFPLARGETICVDVNGSVVGLSPNRREIHANVFNHDGSSGGPLIDARGYVIGILSRSTSGDLGVFVAINRVKHLIASD